MSMSVETIRAGLRAFKEYFDKAGLLPLTLTDEEKASPGAFVPPGLKHAHLAGMAHVALEWPDDRREKMMRWLCFIQGAVWMIGTMSIEDMKTMNKPPEVETT